MAMNTGNIYCRFCGHPNTVESTFCGDCGKQLVGTEELATKQSSSQAPNSSPDAENIQTTNSASSPDAQTHIKVSDPNFVSLSGVNMVPPPPPGFHNLSSGPDYTPPASEIQPGSSPSLSDLTTVNGSKPSVSQPSLPGNFPAPSPSLPSIPTASYHNPATGTFQSQPSLPARRPFWTIKKVLITFTALLLVLLIAGGSIFVYAFQLGKNSNVTQSPTPQTTVGTNPTTAISPTDTPTPDLTTTASASMTSTPDSGTPTADTTAGVTPTAATNGTPPASGTNLYTADFTRDASSWTTGNWSILDGTLINNGHSNDSGTGFVAAPYQPITRDYAITITVEIPSNTCYGFSIVARGASDGSGILATYNNNNQIYVSTSSNTNSDAYSYTPGTNKFTLRLEVKDVSIKVYINNSKSAQVSMDDTSHTDPGLIGLEDDYCQAQVFSFKVDAL